MSRSAKILVTGSNGQLGSELKELAGSYSQYEFVFFSRDELSITDRESVDKVFEEHRPAYFINTAAYTAVDKAESEQELAFEINGHAIGHIAYLCNRYHTKLIHISTDYVFNGNSKSPLKETDDVDPVNAYGSSKLMGEYKAEKNDPSAIIIRTSWVYSSYGKNFVKTMIRLMKAKESISVVNDQLGSPTYAADLAAAIMQIIDSGTWVPGIYHFSNEGVITWFDFAKEIRRLVHSGCEVHPISTEQYPTPAKRPAYSVMDTSRIRETYSINIKDWKKSLELCIHKMQSAH